MGMDLIPRRKGAESVHYNWSGWRALIDFLEGAEVSTENFDHNNDSHHIPAETCRRVADAIEAQAPAYNAIYGGTPKADAGHGDDPATEHAKAWRLSGGMRQF